MAKSLVLITVDCLRADHVGFLGYHRNTTPFLDKLSKSSVVFSNAIVAGAPTYYSFPAIMASRHPLAFGRDVIGIAPEEVTLATTLRESGYATAAFLAGNPYLSSRFGYEAGFETFHDFLDARTPTRAFVDLDPISTRNRFNLRFSAVFHKSKLGGRIYDELYFRYCQAMENRSESSLETMRRFPSADVLVNESLAWVENISPQPFFLWLHFMDPHSPYYPKEEALQWMEVKSTPVRARYLNSYWNRGDVGLTPLAKHRAEIVSLYDACIRWTDFQMERLVQELQSRKLWDDCVFAVTADHGEEFLEHGGRYHSPSKLTEELIHIPLLVRSSKCTPEIRSGPFSLVALPPTILDAMGIGCPENFRGASAWQSPQSKAGEPVVTESIGTCSNPFKEEQRHGPRVLAVRDSTYKLIIDFASSQDYLFDLQKDPSEIHPLAADVAKPERRRLLEYALRHLATSSCSQDSQYCLSAQLRELRLTCDEMVVAA